MARFVLRPVDDPLQQSFATQAEAEAAAQAILASGRRKQMKIIVARAVSLVQAGVTPTSTTDATNL